MQGKDIKLICTLIGVLIGLLLPSFTDVFSAIDFTNVTAEGIKTNFLMLAFGLLIELVSGAIMGAFGFLIGLIIEHSNNYSY